MDLCNACQRGNYRDVVKYLQNTNSSVNLLVEKQLRKCTALHYAAEVGHMKIVKELIQYGANPNIKSSEERLPLHYACVGGHHEVVQCLIPPTCDINSLDRYGQSAAHICCFHGETQCLKMLIDENADLTIQDGNQRSCIELTLISDHSCTLNLLLEQKTELAISPDGQTPIHCAGRFDAVHCLSVFKKHSFDLNMVDCDGISPAHIAAKHGNLRALKCFLKYGVPVYHVDNMNRNILHFAAYSNNLACLHWAAQQTVNVSAVDIHGNSAAHYVTSAESINCLLRHGADLTLENQNGDTPFFCSRKAGYPVAFRKALSGEIFCHLCNKDDQKNKDDEAHKPSIVQEKISSSQLLLFEPRERITTAKKSLHAPPSKTNFQYQFLPKNRDLSARFYGPDLFDSLPITKTKVHGSSVSKH